ncbi:MAG: hypothetical protein WC683_09875 [bacterium]
MLKAPEPIRFEYTAPDGVLEVLIFQRPDIDTTADVLAGQSYALDQFKSTELSRRYRAFWDGHGPVKDDAEPEDVQAWLEEYHAQGVGVPKSDREAMTALEMNGVKATVALCIGYERAGEPVEIKPEDLRAGLNSSGSGYLDVLKKARDRVFYSNEDA